MNRFQRDVNAFLALERNHLIDEERWKSLCEVALAHKITDGQLFKSAVTGLWRNKNCVNQLQWDTFLCRTRAKLRRDDCVELFDAIEKEIQKTLSNHAVSSPKELIAACRPSKKEHVEIIDLVESPSPSNEAIQHRKPVRFDGFHMLRTIDVADHGHALGIEDIIIPGADMAVICNYKIDLPWLWTRAPAIQTCRKVLIVHGESKEVEEDWIKFLRAEGASDRVRFVKPWTSPYGTVHTKAFLLFYPNGCRVCIHTANLIDQDWKYKTQGAYLRDFPVIKHDSSGNKIKRSNIEFDVELVNYFEKCLKGEEKEETLRMIQKYDFLSAGVAIVTSVPGVHERSRKELYGSFRLRYLLQTYVKEIREDSAAVCQFSSLGSIHKKWLEQEFHETLFACKRSEEVKRSKASEEIQLVFPTVEQVQASNEGTPAGSSLPVTARNMHREHIRCRLHKWEASESNREKAMPHIKTFLRYALSCPDSPLWVLLGSFNLSVAAWGRILKARKGFCVKRLQILSYEMGVLFVPDIACPPNFRLDCSSIYGVPLQKEQQAWLKAKENECISLGLDQNSQATASGGSDELSIARNGQHAMVYLPVPYRVPPPRYGTTDIPWTTEYCLMM